MFHLPDLPHVGYATRREKALSDAIMQFMREVERDRMRLLTIVIEGPERWRAIAGEIWRGLRIGQEDGALDAIYTYFVLQAATSQPALQRALLAAVKNTPKFRELTAKLLPHIERERDLLARFT